MKYIRTKEDKIIKIDENGCIKEFDVFGKKTLFAFRDKNYSYRFENGKEIINQADTIKELITIGDLVILTNEKNEMASLVEDVKWFKCWLEINDLLKIKGLYIKVNNDFKRVAKMNDKGDLELI